MENVVNLEQLNYRDQMIKEYVDSKIQPSPTPVPTKAKEHVVDFTFRQRKRVKFQNRVLMTNNSQEWPMWFEVGHLKGVNIDLSQDPIIKFDIPSWFDFENVDLGKDGTIYIYTTGHGIGEDSLRYRCNRYIGLGKYVYIENNKLCVDLVNGIGSPVITTAVYIFARYKIHHHDETEFFKPYILTYTPQGIRREYIDNCDVKVMHNHFTMKILEGRLYKGEFDQLIKSKHGYSKLLSRSELSRLFVDMFENKYIPGDLQNHLWVKRRIGNRRSTMGKTYKNYSFKPGFGNGLNFRRWVYIPMDSWDDRYTQGPKHGLINREIAYTAEPWDHGDCYGGKHRADGVSGNGFQRNRDNYKRRSPISNKQGYVLFTFLLERNIKQGLPGRPIQLRKTNQNDWFMCNRRMNYMK